MTERKYMDVEDLDVYRKPCQLHIEVCDPTRRWPKEEIRVGRTSEAFIEQFACAACRED